MSGQVTEAQEHKGVTRRGNRVRRRCSRLSTIAAARLHHHHNNLTMAFIDLHTSDRLDSWRVSLARHQLFGRDTGTDRSARDKSWESSRACKHQKEAPCPGFTSRRLSLLEKAAPHTHTAVAASLRHQMLLEGFINTGGHSRGHMKGLARATITLGQNLLL